MLVVADSSALVALAVCQCLHLLDDLFKDVNVPQSVYDEVVVPNKPEAEILRNYLERKIASIDLTGFIIDIGGLGRGELEAMALYKKLRADFLLVDDKRARKVASLNDIEIIGSQGVLLFAKQQGLIKKIKPFIDKLLSSDIYVSERLIKKTLQLAKEAD
jgi:predicted nucleic acid-binding protein